MAIGLTLTMVVIRLPNFAHAEYITVGAYAALFASLSATGNPIIVLGAAFLGGAAIALGVHYFVYLPLKRVDSSLYVLILASFAVGLILRYLLFFFVDRFDLFDKRIQVAQVVWFQNETITLTNTFFWVVPTSIGLVLLLGLLINYSHLGREMRALADNETMAKVIGIQVERVQSWSWLLAGGLAGIAGALWGLYTFVNPLIGWLAILSVFAATVLGGMTSFVGTIGGAYLVALAENTLMQLLNYYLGIDFSLKPAVPFIIITVVLLVRPQGLSFR